MNLIVGGTGFIGGHFAEYLFGQGEISKAIFRKGSLIRILDQCGVENYEGDLLDRESLHEPLHGAEVVYNLASAMPGSRDDAGYLVNTLGVRNLLEEAKEHGVGTFVHLGTLDVYGLRPRTVGQSSEPAPADTYQSSKLEAEKILLEFAKDNPDMKVRIVRAAKAVGPRDPTLTIPLLAMEESGKVAIPAKRGARMSFTHPKDVAQALFKASSPSLRGQVYLVKSFDADAFELAESLSSACGLGASIKEQGMLSGKTLFPDYTVRQLRGGLILEGQESWKELGYAPAYDLGRLCAEVRDWHKKEPWATKELPT